MRIILKDFHIVDGNQDIEGTVVVDNGIIRAVKKSEPHPSEEIIRHIKAGLEHGKGNNTPAMIIHGGGFVKDGNPLPLLMPSFVDLHAHFRDSCSTDKDVPQPAETIESASMAAAAGGYGTLICMANTNPVTDTIEKAASVKNRADALGLINLFPVISLTKNMEGKELSGITSLPNADEKKTTYLPLMLSEDGKDIANDDLFLSALKEAKRAGIPVSCHCDFGGTEAAELKKQGKPRSIWSRVEEINAVKRAIELGQKAGCHIHIAHVSTKEAVETIRAAKNKNAEAKGTFKLTCEAMPHNIILTEKDAERLGAESFGRVNPPLRSEEDIRALIAALRDGTIDAIATDHAPHFLTDKEKGSPGFSGLETTFSACYTTLVLKEGFSLRQLSRLMSAAPAKIIGLGNQVSGCASERVGASKRGDTSEKVDASFRGEIREGYRADLVIIDPSSQWTVDPSALKTRGKNSPFAGLVLDGKIKMTLLGGRIVFMQQ